MDALTGIGAGATASASGGGSVSSSSLGSELSRDAFLILLVTQLQNQDPLEPIGNGEMLAQLAQFTALEQMNKLNESFETLSGNVDQLNFISASQLIGKVVSGLDHDGLPNSGVVEAVGLNGSVVELMVNGRTMSMAGILGIEDVPAP